MRSYTLHIETWTPSGTWEFKNYHKGQVVIRGLRAAQREARRIWSTKSSTFAVHVIIRDASGVGRLPWGRPLGEKRIGKLGIAARAARAACNSAGVR